MRGTIQAELVIRSVAGLDALSRLTWVAKAKPTTKKPKFITAKLTCCELLIANYAAEIRAQKEDGKEN